MVHMMHIVVPVVEPVVRSIVVWHHVHVVIVVHAHGPLVRVEVIVVITEPVIIVVVAHHAVHVPLWAVPHVHTEMILTAGSLMKTMKPVVFPKEKTD